MDKKWEIYRVAAQQAQQKGNLEQAEKSWLAALEEAEDFGLNSPKLTMTLESLGEIYWHQRKFSLAAPICRRVLKIYTDTLGEDHLDVGVIANNLAMLYHCWDKYEEAEEFYKLALGIKRKNLGTDHPDVINLLGNYANLLNQMKRPEDAEKLKAEADEVSVNNWKRSGTWIAFKAT